MLGAVAALPARARASSTPRCAAGSSLAKKDIEGLITLLVDAEMKMFRGLLDAR